MIKQSITLATIFTISLYGNLSLAETNKMEQKTILVTEADKSRISSFHSSVKVKIEKHRKEMKEKKEILENEKEVLKNEVKTTREKNQGKLSEEQKNSFKSRRDLIESKTSQLREENINFINSIDKEREQFFSSIKNK